MAAKGVRWPGVPRSIWEALQGASLSSVDTAEPGSAQQAFILMYFQASTKLPCINKKGHRFHALRGWGLSSLVSQPNTTQHRIRAYKTAAVLQLEGSYKSSYIREKCLSSCMWETHPSHLKLSFEEHLQYHKNIHYRILNGQRLTS